MTYSLIHFMALVSSYTPENLYSSDVIRGYRKRPGAWNGLKRYTMKLVSLFIFICLLDMFFETFLWGIEDIGSEQYMDKKVRAEF